LGEKRNGSGKSREGLNKDLKSFEKSEGSSKKEEVTQVLVQKVNDPQQDHSLKNYSEKDEELYEKVKYVQYIPKDPLLFGAQGNSLEYAIHNLYAAHPRPKTNHQERVFENLSKLNQTKPRCLISKGLDVAELETNMFKKLEQREP